MKKIFIFTVLTLILSSCAPQNEDEPVYEAQLQNDTLPHITDEVTSTADVTETESDNETETVPETEPDLSETAPITEPVTEPVAESDAQPIERPSEYYSADTVYLTFDVGPGRYTERVLEILDEYGVKATFFVVGNSVERYPEMLRMIADKGHSIGAHSMTHDYAAIYASADAIADDLLQWERTVADTIGYVPKERLYRFPGGSTCTLIGEGMFGELRQALDELDYRCFDWTFANNDKYTVNKPAEQPMVDFLKESSVTTLGLCYNRKIMLLHETTAETVEMLPWLIEYLLSEGYKLEPLTYANVGYTFAK